MERVGLEALCERLRNFESLEVLDYEGTRALVQKFKGVVKDKSLIEELGDLSRRRPRGRPDKKMLDALCDTVRELFDRRIKFKVVFMGKDVELRLDEERFVRLGGGEVKIRAPSKEDELVGILIPTLSRLGRIKYLRRLK